MSRSKINKRIKEIDRLILLLTDEVQLIAIKAERKRLIISDIKLKKNRRSNTQESIYIKELSDIIKEHLHIARKLGLTTKNQRKNFKRKINRSNAFIDNHKDKQMIIRYLHLAKEIGNIEARL